MSNTVLNRKQQKTNSASQKELAGDNLALIEKKRRKRTRTKVSRLVVLEVLRKRLKKPLEIYLKHQPMRSCEFARGMT